MSTCPFPGLAQPLRTSSVSMEKSAALISRQWRNISSRIVSKPLPDETFAHSPFTDATRQIRLLQFLPGCNDKKIILRQTRWDMDSLPEYNAISYTWGDPEEPVPVVVNDRVLLVRKNCFYALWQASLHYHGTLIWIDSICIDQLNTAEKSDQVAMMGDIYSWAKHVLICVGEAEHDSDFFMREVQRLHRWLIPSKRLGRSVGLVKMYAVAWKWYYWRRLDSAYFWFLKRDYWQRLWIVQEVACAKERVVLCGQQKLPWSMVVSIEMIDFCKIHRDPDLDLKFPPRKVLSTVFNCLEPSHEGPPKLSLDAVFMYLRRQFCSDFRDRLYGALRMVDWSSTTVGKIVPDYNLSSYELALRVLPDIGWTTTVYLIKAFGMAHDDRWVVQHRKERKVYERAEFREPSGSSVIPEKIPSSVYRSVKLYASFVPIKCQVSGRFTAGLTERSEPLKGFDIPESLLSSSILTSMEPQPRKILSGEQIQVLACASTLPGDMLMDLFPALLEYSRDRGGHHMSGVYLVVRQRSEFMFDVVGQAVGLRSLCASSKSSRMGIVE